MERGLPPGGAETPPTRQNMRDILIAHSWFADLPDRLVTQMAEISVLRRYAAGDLIHSKAARATFLHGVVSGAVRVSSTSIAGREAILTYYGPGDWFGHIALIDGLARTHDIHAQEDSVLVNIAHHDFNALLRAEPELYRHIALMLCRLLRLSFAWIEDAALLSLPARLAKQLLSLARSYGEAHGNGTLIRLRLPQEDLAMLLGTTRQTINRRLSDWAKLGWISVHYGEILILDRQALQNCVDHESETLSGAPIF
ncbi:Crp/Fnr family transcriptional regulator [Gluconacetobacter tumulisoli]|uniref:Crp/Fnr family transcriptional regulator n=1 Tax=Gluconacetobacter tumulisoli TaxID=1286189 RepID=A0A7W4K9H1_9PROT|nr:Crp/Fnr family transcriptional regulator [Gluconacetobacter tumulisoli]MBB2202770.1 Crp/Fnr family transcriptional regulator [Gluconacetobacter tumulisoli]